MAYPSNEPDAPDPKDAEAAAIESAFNELMGKSLQEILQEGQKVLFARLVGTARAGLATHQELAILRNILKDNGLTLGIPPEVPHVREDYEGPAPELPHYEAPEWGSN